VRNGTGASRCSRVRALDERLLRRLSRRQRTRLDGALALVSRAADRGLLWAGVAALLATAVPGSGPRAARRGLLSLGAASALANGPLKILSRRRRPTVRLSAAGARWLRRPLTSSFPSGHSASAFAFATGAAVEAPALAVPLLALAATVAYSRAHTRVHYPSDVVAGAALGVATAIATGHLPSRLSGLLGQGQQSSQREGPLLGFQRAVLVSSPHAGRAARHLHRARKAIESSGIRIVRELPVDQAGKLREFLGEQADERLLVVAAGGDGTAGTVGDVLAGTGAVMGVVPLGTSNDFARSLGIHTNVEKAVELLREGKVSTIDLGCMVPSEGNATHFVHAATAGLNVSFARLATRASFRRRLGRLTYAAAAILALREHRPFGCRLVVDGRSEEVELHHLSVINAPVFGGYLGLRLRNSSVDDRLLDVLAVENAGLRRTVVAAALQAALGVRRELSGVRSYHVKELEVDADQKQEVALDGEVRGKLPASFVVAGEALKVVTPIDFQDIDDPIPNHSRKGEGIRGKAR
jgi:YegS/Rv2252/BmrU family lipid kinase